MAKIMVKCPLCEHEFYMEDYERKPCPRCGSVQVGPNCESVVNMSTCFVIMPFSEPVNQYYTDIFAPAIKEAGLKPVRADEIEEPGVIIKQIWQGILEAEVVVADLTGRNANVMYELGLAHALGKPVLQLVQSISDLPFDLRALRHIVYQTNIPGWDKTLSEQITEILRAIIKDPDSCTIFHVKDGSEKNTREEGISESEAIRFMILGSDHARHILRHALAEALRMSRERLSDYDQRYKILISCIQKAIEQEKKKANITATNNKERFKKLLAGIGVCGAETIFAEFESKFANNPNDNPIKVFQKIILQRESIYRFTPRWPKPG